MRVLANCRKLSSSNAELTGCTRYLSSLLAEMKPPIAAIEGGADGLAGVYWEQVVLPRQARNSLLWSPCNTGPLSVANQVLTVHDVIALDHPEWFSKQFALWYSLLLPRLIPRVKRVIAVSEFTRSRILALTAARPENVVTILNGVESRFSVKTEAETQRVAAKLGLPSRRYLLSVGTFQPRKNLLRLLEAWTRVHESLPPDVWLILTGSKGSLRVFRDEGLRELPPRVHLTGYVDDELLPALYSGAAGFLYPSVYEGFGLPALEAMACGVPTLTGNLSSLPEVVGDAALTVDPLSVDAIARGILQLLQDNGLRSRLQARSLERAKGFTWERAAEQTWNVLADAAGQPQTEESDLAQAA